MFRIENFVDSFLFTWIKVCNYLAMLAVMTYNNYVIVLIAFSLAFSNYVFSRLADKRLIDRTILKNGGPNKEAKEISDRYKEKWGK